MKIPRSMGPNLCGPKFYLDCIRINFDIEFSRTWNGNVIVFGMKFWMCTK